MLVIGTDPDLTAKTTLEFIARRGK